MARARDVTEAELAILEVLWECGEQTVRDLADRLYPTDASGAGGNSESATVQKLCERLEGKELVVADRSRRPKRYRAVVDRASLTERRLRAVADDLHDGALAPLMSQLLRGGSFTTDEIASLREEVDRLAAEAGKSSTQRSRGKRGRR